MTAANEGRQPPEPDRDREPDAEDVHEQPAADGHEPPAAGDHGPPAAESGHQPSDRDDRQPGRGPVSARVLAGVVLAVGVLALVGLSVRAVDAFVSDGGRVPVVATDLEATLDGVPGDLPEGTRLEVRDERANLDLVVDVLPAGLRAMAVAGELLTGVLVLIGAWLLSRVLRDLGAGHPFTAATPRRIRGLALVVLVWALVPPSLDNAAAAAVIAHLGSPHAPLPLGFTILSLHTAPLLAAAAIAVVAEAFRHGQRLVEDVEGLV